jgi:hypothetical protein
VSLDWRSAIGIRFYLLVESPIRPATAAGFVVFPFKMDV